MTTEENAAAKRDTEKSAPTGITLKLGPDSKMAIPIQGGNLAMMAVILWKMLTTFASIPDQIDTIAGDMVEIKSDISDLKNKDTELANANGALDSRVKQLETANEKLETRVHDLEDFHAEHGSSTKELLAENKKLRACVANPDKCD